MLQAACFLGLGLRKGDVCVQRFLQGPDRFTGKHRHLVHIYVRYLLVAHENRSPLKKEKVVGTVIKFGNV